MFAFSRHWQFCFQVAEVSRDLLKCIRLEKSKVTLYKWSSAPSAGWWRVGVMFAALHLQRAWSGTLWWVGASSWSHREYFWRSVGEPKGFLVVREHGIDKELGILPEPSTCRAVTLTGSNSPLWGWSGPFRRFQGWTSSDVLGRLQTAWRIHRAEKSSSIFRTRQLFYKTRSSLYYNLKFLETKNRKYYS